MGLRPGDYAVVQVVEATGHTLRGTAIARTTLLEHASHGGDQGREVLGAALAASRVREAAPGMP